MVAVQTSFFETKLSEFKIKRADKLTFSISESFSQFKCMLNPFDGVKFVCEVKQGIFSRTIIVNNMASMEQCKRYLFGDIKLIKSVS